MNMKYRLKTVYIPSDGRKLKLLVLIPQGKPAAGVLWIHGGGFLTGMSEMVFMTRGRALCEKYGALVISPAYRLSLLHPYPSALNDCYAALSYMYAHREEYGIPEDRIMVGGESAGGGLTVSVCLKARDLGVIPVSYQMPLYPMLDHRDTDSSRDNHAPVWNTRKNHLAWALYLRDLHGSIPYYASPALCEDVRGLPPAYTFVGSIEPFLDETCTYIQKLKDAGIPASMDIWPDKYHAFDLFEIKGEVRKQAVERFEEHFRKALEGIYE